MGNSLTKTRETGRDFSAALALTLYKGADFRSYCQVKVNFMALVSCSWLLWPKVYQHGDLYLLRETSNEAILKAITNGATPEEIELSNNSFHLADEFAQTNTEFDLELAMECRDIIEKSWQLYIPTQIGRSISIHKTDFDESYGPTISFHSQR